MEHTEYYQLSLWEQDDRIQMEDFNADNAKIDAALASGAKIAVGSYVGNGQYGASHPNTLTFDFEPKVVIVTAPNSGLARALFWPGEVITHVQYDTVTDSVENTAWSDGGRTLQWHHYSRPEQQLNLNGYVYHYIALG